MEQQKTLDGLATSSEQKSNLKSEEKVVSSETNNSSDTNDKNTNPGKISPPPNEQKTMQSGSGNDEANILASIKREANSESSDSNSDKSTVAASRQQPVFGDSPAFNVNQSTRPVTGILSNILSAASQSLASVADKQAPPLPKVKLDDDEWAKKLKNYAEHGASSLKNGEAFMFAEDTGEASLFLADGTTIRRIVAQPKDSNEVMRERRPDISHAELPRSLSLSRLVTLEATTS
jgi:hypothetical protein